jgi:hypothetical protein
MSNSYRLVNPNVQGDFEVKIKSKNSINAAKLFYKNLSEHFNNNIPSFYFTIQKGGSGKGKYYHFSVKESRTENEEVRFKVEPYTIANETSTIKNFESNLQTFKSKFEQAGGRNPKGKKNTKKHPKNKRLDDSDSDLDSSDNFYKRAQTYKPVVTPPLYYWWYDPYVYNISSVFIPTFYSYVTPYLEIKLN